MGISVNNAGSPAAQSNTDFLTSAAAKLGIDGGKVSASFTDKGETFTLKGEVKDKFDYDGGNTASTNLEASTPFGDNSSLFASANAKSKDGDVTKTYTAGAKYSAASDGNKRTGQITVSNKNGDTSYQAKGSLKDTLSNDATLSLNMQFDYAGENIDVKESGQLVVPFEDGIVDSLTIGEYGNSKKGSGVTLSVDDKFSDDFSGSAGVGVFDNGSSIAAAGVEYAMSDDTSLYANVSSYAQEGADNSYGAQIGVKTKLADNLDVNVGAYTSDYTEFKDAAAPKPHEETVYANVSWKF